MPKPQAVTMNTDEAMRASLRDAIPASQLLSQDDAGMYRSMGVDPPKNSKPPPYGGRPKFVKFIAGDKGENLPHVFYEDPRTLKAEPGPRGEVHAWGIYPYTYENPEDNNRRQGKSDELNWPACDDFDGVQAMIRQMKIQTLYGVFSTAKMSSPETQFMDSLLERKAKQLKALDLRGMDKRDVILKIYISGMRDKKGEYRVWRRFKVSAGIGLSAFQDKVVAPIMGWVRNFHCYTFTDYRDGALFGPIESTSVDRTHVAQIGYQYLPDDKYKFAHLFSKEGDKIGYLYDFGDKWYHNIVVEKILSSEQSNGAIEIIDGKGMCPGENLNGSWQYNDLLDDYERGSVTEKYKKKKEILASPNYSAFGKPPSQFDPFAFDIKAARERLSDALGATSSVPSGAKKFTIPMVPGGERIATEMESKHLKKGQKISTIPDEESHGFWTETSSSNKDRSRAATCASCGKPAAKDVELKQCAGCHQVLYCSPDHQKAHWKASHKRQCTRQYVS